MALTVKDVMELPSGRHMDIAAGEKGLNRPVVSVEIADYEFAPNVEFVAGETFDPEENMEPGNFVITSFLFAKDDPSLIFSTVKKLEEKGISGLAFKRIIYDRLPEEVLEYADKKKFPILSFGSDVWFENIIFDIMYAVQFDDKEYLSEEKIRAMLAHQMNRSELEIILKGISLKLKKYIAAVYITGDGYDAGRILRSFYMLKGFNSKALMVRFGSGLFLITTSARGDFESHDLIRKEVFELLGLRGKNDALPAGEPVETGMSEVHEPAELDRAFRESRFCYVASAAESRPTRRFGESGIFRLVLPALDNYETKEFAREFERVFSKSEDFKETAFAYVASAGDVAKTGGLLHCHQNTVRYRLGRIRELVGLSEVPESEFYLQLKTALAIISAREILEKM